jgi:hypothetical protein
MKKKWKLHDLTGKCLTCMVERRMEKMISDLLLSNATVKNCEG